MVADNVITNSEIKAYRLRHHDFDGLSVMATAESMKCTPRRVQQLLKNLKVKAPQLFPILTPGQARDYHLCVNEGWTMTEIGEHTDHNVRTVSTSIKAAVKKVLPKCQKSQKMVRYYENMGDKIKEKF